MIMFRTAKNNSNHPKLMEAGLFGEIAVLGMDRDAKNGRVHRVISKTEKTENPKVAEYGLGMLFGKGKFGAMEDAAENSKIAGMKEYARARLAGITVADVERAAKNEELDVATAVVYAKDRGAWMQGVDILAKRCGGHSNFAGQCLQYVCLCSTDLEKAGYALAKLPREYLGFVSENAALQAIRERAASGQKS